MNLSQIELREIPIRASLWKPVLLAGADRKLTITVIGCCMMLVLISRFSFWPCIAAILFGTFGQLFSIKLSSRDPQMIDVYLRHISFNRTYSARPEFGSRKPKYIPSIPPV